MIKRVEFFSLASGKSSDEAWDFFTKIYAPSVAQRLDGLKKYVVSRAVEPWPERVGEMGGQPYWWGVSEQWFDNAEQCERAVMHLLDHPLDIDVEMNTYIDQSFGSAIVKEHTIIENTVPEKHCKRLGIFTLANDQRPEDAWNYWVNIHSANWKYTSPGCHLYRICCEDIAPWGKPTWWGFLEQRFDNVDAIEKCMRYPRPKDDFKELFMRNLTGGIGYCEELKIM